MLYFVGSLGSALAWDWYSFLAFRLLGGLAVGGASVVSPLYIAEISPARLRGRLVAIQQFNVVLGILVAFLSNYLIARMNLGADGMAMDAGDPGGSLGRVLPPPVAHRPRAPAGSSAGAASRRPGPSWGGWELTAAAIDEEVAVIKALARPGASRAEATPSSRRSIAWPILLAVAIAMFNQLSGINALMYYAPTIFKMAGAGRGLGAASSGRGRRHEPAVHPAGDGGHRLLRPAQADPHRLDRLHHQPGRPRPGPSTPMARSSPGRARSSCWRACSLFIASHAFGQGAVIWVFISEIFPNRVRARGQALGSTTHWVMAALISWTFPIIAKSSGRPRLRLLRGHDGPAAPLGAVPSCPRPRACRWRRSRRSWASSEIAAKDAWRMEEDRRQEPAPTADRPGCFCRRGLCPRPDPAQAVGAPGCRRNPPNS